MSHPDQFTHEAKELAALRRHRRAPEDPLAKRMKSAQFWTECNKTNPNYGLVHVWVFYRKRGFRRYVMPGLRSFLDGREKARKAQYEAELRESIRQWHLRKALAKAPPLPLFTETA